MATLTDINVNGGTAIDLQADKIVVTFEVFSPSNDLVPNQSTAESDGYGTTEPSDWTTRLAKSQYLGYANPRIVITGMYDRTISHATNDTNDDIDYIFFQSFIASSATKTLIDAEFFPSGRTIRILNVVLTKTTKSGIMYTMNCTEVQS